jgi:hypothetical protein
MTAESQNSGTNGCGHCSTRLGKQVYAATNLQAAIAELLETFSMWSVPKLHNIGQGKPRQRKYKRLKLGGGQAYDYSSD